MHRNGNAVSAGAVVFSALICWSVPAPAESAAEYSQSPSPAEIQRAEEEDPKVCKRFKPTGSAIAKRFCYRKSTWEKMQKESQEMLRDIKRAPVDASGG